MNMRSTRQRNAYMVLVDIGKYLVQVPSDWSSLNASFCSSDKILYNCSNHMPKSYTTQYAAKIAEYSNIAVT